MEKTMTKTTKRTILLVEDELAISNVCRRVLARDGIEVDTAANGLVAQNLIRKKRYDLCLIDIRIPAMNGEELYQWLAAEYPQLTSQVIFTTGDVIGRDTQGFLKRVARPFLPKPFSPEELRTIVREALQKVTE